MMHQPSTKTQLRRNSRSAWRAALLITAACNLMTTSNAPCQELSVPVTGISAVETRAAIDITETVKSTGQTRSYLQEAFDVGLKEEVIDAVYLLTKERSDVALPLLERRLADAIEDEDLDTRQLYLMADVLAYAANEEALEALTRLVDRSPAVFAVHTRGLLLYAKGRRNPYVLALTAIEGQQRDVALEAADWVRRQAPVGRGYEKLASALNLRFRAQREGESPDLAGMAAILRRIFGPEPPQELLDEVTRQLTGGVSGEAMR